MEIGYVFHKTKKDDYILRVVRKRLKGGYKNYIYVSLINSEGKLKCSNCHKYVRSYFMVPENSWFNVVPKKLWKKHICFKCYKTLRATKGLKPIKYSDVQIKKGRSVLRVTKKSITFGKITLMKKPIFTFTDD